MSQENIQVEKEEKPDYDIGCMGHFLVAVSSFFIIMLFPITIWFCVKIVQEYERAAIFRLGRLKQEKAVGPGMFWVNMFTDSYIKVIFLTSSQILETSCKIF